MKNGFSLRGLKKVLLQRPADADALDVSGGPALAAFGPLPATAGGKRGRDLVDFLGQATLFEDFSHADLTRLARSAHERNYRDGEYIYEQGSPGAALFLVRSGVVEIARRRRNGEEVPIVTLEPPASFSEQAAMGAHIVRWNSARARGPVCLVAFASSDLDALGRSLPLLANKILRKLAQITATRLQLIVEGQFFSEEGQDGKPQDEHPE
jgi:hypothetical protein